MGATSDGSKIPIYLMDWLYTKLTEDEALKVFIIDPSTLAERYINQPQFADSLTEFPALHHPAVSALDPRDVLCDSIRYIFATRSLQPQADFLPRPEAEDIASVDVMAFSDGWVGAANKVLTLTHIRIDDQQSVSISGSILEGLRPDSPLTTDVINAAIFQAVKQSEWVVVDTATEQGLKMDGVTKNLLLVAQRSGHIIIVPISVEMIRRGIQGPVNTWLHPVPEQVTWKTVLLPKLARKYDLALVDLWSVVHGIFVLRFGHSCQGKFPATYGTREFRAQLYYSLVCRDYGSGEEEDIEDAV
ncbi:hypothetical protein B0H67DRAFT_551556 [Lasiosphaeris hirsuta]|uniref:Uncharacterized protein n=1 Tax=Lasiosphaeris hirsuta TaxID=260670 RepID=A0AA40E1E6_9PEZI|nr:hypothetical protein B0H67DRAFT_551556 [Lasiosphaeris hirsuta]